jgi:hypothetical protein
MKIFIIAFLLIILYNMFSKRQCFQPLCFLNQREGLVANRDNIAKNTADITTLHNDLNSAISRMEALNPKIAETAAAAPIHMADYELLPARVEFAKEQVLKDDGGSGGCNTSWSPSF